MVARQHCQLEAASKHRETIARRPDLEQRSESFGVVREPDCYAYRRDSLKLGPLFVVGRRAHRVVDFLRRERRLVECDRNADERRAERMAARLQRKL